MLVARARVSNVYIAQRTLLMDILLHPIYALDSTENESKWREKMKKKIQFKTVIDRGEITDAFPIQLMQLKRTNSNTHILGRME